MDLPISSHYNWANGNLDNYNSYENYNRSDSYDGYNTHAKTAMTFLALSVVILKACLREQPYGLCQIYYGKQLGILLWKAYLS